MTLPARGRLLIADRFRVSPDELRDLAQGNSSPPLLDLLAAGRRSKNLALLRALVLLTADGPDGPATAQALRLLRRAEAADPPAVARVLAEPVVGAWLAQTVRGLTREHRSPPTGSPGAAHRLALVAAAAGHAARVSVRITVPATGTGRIELPTLGVARLQPGTGRAVFESDTGSSSIVTGTDRVLLAVDRPDWDAERRLHLPGPPSWHFGVDPAAWLDLPAALHRSEPADRQLQGVWRSRLSAAWDLLTGGHPAAAAEVRAIFSQVLPITGSPGAVRSSTFRDAYGLVALSTPTLDPRWTAVSLAHEAQHAKLAALMDLFPLVRRDATQRFEAPWRDEPRPAVNLLHGAYAHLAVARFWHRQQHRERPGPDRRRAEAAFRRWSTATLSTVLTLEQADVLTDSGRQFIGWMREPLEQWT